MDNWHEVNTCYCQILESRDAAAGWGQVCPISHNCADVSSRKAIIRTSSESEDEEVQLLRTQNLTLILHFSPRRHLTVWCRLHSHTVNLANSKMNILNSFSPSYFILDCLLLRQFYLLLYRIIAWKIPKHKAMFELNPWVIKVTKIVFCNNSKGRIK